MSSLFDSIEFFNNDALIDGKTSLPHVSNLLAKNFWIDNISNRFYTSLNYLFPIMGIVLFFMGCLALVVFPNGLKYGDSNLSSVQLFVFFSIIILITAFGKGLKWLLPEKGFKLVTLQNDLILCNDKVYNEYLDEWGWNNWLFFISLISFAAPFMMCAFVLSFIIYKLHKEYKSKKHNKTALSKFNFFFRVNGL